MTLNKTAKMKQETGEKTIWLAHLDPNEVLRFEIIGRAATPVHDVLVLAFTSQFAVPVGEPQVVVHHGLTVGAVLQNGVEK